jgi:hypothetical protein
VGEVACAESDLADVQVADVPGQHSTGMSEVGEIAHLGGLKRGDTDPRDHLERSSRELYSFVFPHGSTDRRAVKLGDPGDAAQKASEEHRR